MTTQQLHLFNAMYLVLFILVTILTRATQRRMIGALAGGAVAGLAAIGMIAFGQNAGWWHMAIDWTPYYLTLLWLDFALCAFVFLITWRVARRFGWRGLAVALILAAVIGPPRDRWYMERFPEWGSYAPGLAPMLAVSATYVILGVLGHGLMRLIAGSARADRLASRPWNCAFIKQTAPES